MAKQRSQATRQPSAKAALKAPPATSPTWKFTTRPCGMVTGGGTIDYLSSGVVSRLPVSWASRTSAHDGKTSPEELLAAAHAICFSMALSARLAKNGTRRTSSTSRPR